jgi:tRNA uridine 5-carbamoylmethylation protein Kti12
MSSLRPIVNQLAETMHRTKSDVARDMLRKQIALAKLHELRREFIPYAEKTGYLTDEDVFRDVS